MLERYSIDSTATKLDTLSASQKIQRLVRFAALERLLSMGHHAEELEASRPELPIFSHWTALILLAGDGGRLTFKVHYAVRDVRGLVARTLGRPEDKLHKSLVADFMKEYCNLTAGVVKAGLAEVGIHTGLSLPVVTRGFDEVWQRPSDSDLDDLWLLRWPTGHMTCTLGFNGDIWPEAYRLVEPEFRADSSSGLEFL